MQWLFLSCPTSTFQALWRYTCSHGWIHDIHHISYAFSILVALFTSTWWWWWYGCWWSRSSSSNHSSTPWSCASPGHTKDSTHHSYSTTTITDPSLYPLYLSSFSFQKAEKADQTWFYSKYPGLQTCRTKVLLSRPCSLYQRTFGGATCPIPFDIIPPTSAANSRTTTA